LSQLSNYAGVTAEELERDMEKAWSAEHGLQLCIQVVLDIGNHILAENGVTVEDYGSIFKELAAMDVIPHEFVNKVKGMTGFRNILVHEYGSVDLGKVAHVLNNSLEDFHRFAVYIMKYIE
jgi:uncharacterized protein YutE (UPF0331/DUF86 family)